MIPTRSNNRRTFLVRFAVVIVCLYVAISTAAVDDVFVLPLTRAIASVASGVLLLVGESVESRDVFIRGEDFAIQINNGCNGVEVLVFIVAAIVAFPSRWSRRLRGIVAAIIIIQGLNLLRVVSLFLIGRYWSSGFQVAHLVIWQTLMFAATILFFVRWSKDSFHANLAARA